MSWIPLLSLKPLLDFTPAEFKAYVNSLKQERKSRGKKTAGRKPLIVKLKRLKSGKLSITTRRVPKYITPDEYKEMTLTTAESELSSFLHSQGFSILTHQEAEKIKRDLTEVT